MTTIIEDYVSFEIAKLLVKKGFDFNAEYESYYTLGGVVIYFKDNTQDINIAPRITIQMAMKWLREVHNLCIEPYRTASGYLYTISKIWTGSEIYSDEFNGDDEASGQWTTYEKACEAGIKYCLENLI